MSKQRRFNLLCRLGTIGSIRVKDLFVCKYLCGDEPWEMVKIGEKVRKTLLVYNTNITRSSNRGWSRGSIGRVITVLLFEKYQ